MSRIADLGPAGRIPTESLFKRLVWLTMFAAAMGLLEAICVIYIRTAFPADEWFMPPEKFVRLEEIREFCTLVMLVAAGWFGGVNARTRLSSFVFAFGAWDIVYYVGLWELGDWQAGLLDWDLLFLIPEPWYGPVLAPVLVSVYFMAACSFVFIQEGRRRPVLLSARNLGVQLLAGGIWYVSFVENSERITAHGYDGASYSWSLFALGALVGVVGLWTGSEPRVVTQATPAPQRAPAEASA